jgi:tricorn protease
MRKRVDVPFAAVLVRSGAVLVLAASAATGTPTGDAAKGFFRWPDVSATDIVFVYCDQLWLVGREGGEASPLVTGSTSPRRSKFSADGGSIAYVGDFDGLYTIPAEGGSPFRITHHPGSTDLCDWTASGVLLFMTDAFVHVFDGDGQARVRQLFTVAPSGGLPVKLPLAYGANGAMSEDGRWLAFTLYAEGRTEYRAHNRGGNAPDVWLFDLQTSESRRITDGPGIDTTPLWHDGVVYYLSDGGPERRLNVWSYVLATRDRRQLTSFDDFDVKWPSMGPGPHGRGEIVFSQGTGLFLLDLETGSSRRIPVSFPAGTTEPELRTFDAAPQVQKAVPAADGSKAVLEARGDLWIAAEEGQPRNLTTTSGIAERDPSMSPDGRWIAYFSDAEGDYQLYVAPADASGPGRRLSNLGAGFRYGPIWSPDSKRIVFSDSTGGLYLASLERGDTMPFDKDPLVRQPHPSWSPDSHWIAYARGADGNPRSTSIWLYDIEAAKAHQVSSGWHSDEWPVFDRAGEYLFFVRLANAGAILFDVIDVNNFIYPTADLVLAVPLRRGIGSPWLPRPDGDPIPTAPERVRVEIDGFEQRAVVVSSESGDYSDLAVTASDALAFQFKSTSGSASIRLLDFRKGRANRTPSPPKTVLGAVDGFSIAANGRRLLVRTGGKMGFIEAAEEQSLTAPLALTGMEVRPEPRAEWHQAFTDAWRMFRDFFYDASMRGVDWTAVRTKYAPLLDACASRSDVDLVIGDMAGELGSSHVFVGSAPAGAEEERTGMLGVDFTLDRGAYRFAKIHDGGIADASGRNPLRRAGLTVAEGEYLLAVNRTPVDTTRDPWAAFKGLSGRPVTLTVGPEPTIDDTARTVVITPHGSEDVLRNRAWVEANRLEVARATEGRVGYVYLANTHDYGSTEFTRQLAGQLDREGVIIDERWNEGGYAPFHFVDVLARKRYMYFGGRGAVGGRTPDYFIDGPVCMLINEISYSGGDMLPYFFRARGLGPLIGRRTLGGMVGAGINPPLIDGGFLLVPFVAFYASSTGWAVEGTGVEPDIDVIDDPAALARGEDPQLEAAIRFIEGELRNRARTVVPGPPGTR